MMEKLNLQETEQLAEFLRISNSTEFYSQSSLDVQLILCHAGMLLDLFLEYF